MRVVAFLLSSLIGFLIGHYLLTGAVAAYTSVLVSNHLYLGFLIIVSDHKTGISLPIGFTILTHLAFLLVAVGLPYLREHIPFFSAVGLLVPALAPFEANWLFRSETTRSSKVHRKQQAKHASRQELLNASTPEDYESFMEYMKADK